MLIKPSPMRRLAMDISFSQYKLMVLGVFSSLSLGFIASSANAAAGHLTGCLTVGKTVDKIAVGDKPSAGCLSGQKQVTIATVTAANPYNLVPFLVGLDGDSATKAIASYGPFQVSATCKKVPSRASFVRSVEIDVKSSVNGWIDSDGTTLRASNTSAPLDNWQNLPFDQSLLNSDPGPHSALAPDGSHLFLNQVQFGINILGHDCTAAGVITFAKGDAGFSVK